MEEKRDDYGKWIKSEGCWFLIEPSELWYDKNKETSSLKIPTLDEEVAQLWYENMITKSKLNQNEEDVAELWYTIIMGGVVNV